MEKIHFKQHFEKKKREGIGYELIPRDRRGILKYPVSELLLSQRSGEGHGSKGENKDSTLQKLWLFI